MAVYKRTYKTYSGPLTNPRLRFLVLPRYAFRSLFRSRFLLMAYQACFIVPLFTMCMLYLNHNASVLALMGRKDSLVTIDGGFFVLFLQFQGVLAGLLTAFVGPGLVSPDLQNGGLSIYLSRPFSRAEYILGKGLVLGSLIGSITLLPALILLGIQTSLVGGGWLVDNAFLAAGVTLASCLAMAVFILLGLAMSAFVRIRFIAGALVLAVFAAGKGFGALINQVMRVSGGYYLDLQHLLLTVTGSLLRHPADDEPVPALAAGLVLVLFCALLILLINRKLRVCEVAS